MEDRLSFGQENEVIELVDRINEYLQNGGLFNPELMDHDKVRKLLVDCRDVLSGLDLLHVARQSCPKWVK